MNIKILSRILCICGMAAFLLACAASSYHKGMYALDKGDLDVAVKNLDQAVKENPKNLKYKTNMVRAHLQAEAYHMSLAKNAMSRKDYPLAAEEFGTVLQMNPNNAYARDTLQKVMDAAAEKEAADRRARTTIDDMKEQSRNDMGVPQLDPASNIPIVLKFTDTPVKTILDAVSKASGINFLYDDKADVSKRVTVDFAKVSLSQVMDYLMMQTKSFYKVLDPHSLIIVQDNKQKRDEYTDQVIRTFYLSNADAKDVFQLVRSILQTRKMAMNQDLNSITIQDSPDVVAICQRIIEDNDKSKGEVVIDVELLEVDSNLTRQLGVNLSDTSFTIGPKSNLTYDDKGNSTGIGTGPPVPLNEFFKTLSHGLYIYPIPNFIAQMLLQSGSGQILAKPQLRVMEGQKAMVHIGDKWPIPTSNTYNPTGGTIGSTYTPITSYTYQDIGVKIEIEPKVHHNQEITIKLKVEISAISGNIKGVPPSPDQPIIGTRESNSVIRLQDGETSLMAGLISNEERKSLNGVPGISEIPILRRLFSQTKDEGKSTDVVMLLTPHIIRMPNITEHDLKPLWVGTADNPKLKGGTGSSWAPSPFVEKGGAAAAPAAGSPSPGSPTPGTPKAAPDAKPSDPGVTTTVAPIAPITGAQVPATPPQSPDKGGTPATSSLRVMLSPTNVMAKPGDPVFLNLVVVGAQEVKGLHLDMQYPTEALKFEGADEGTFFKLGGGATTFAARETAPGSVSIDMGRNDGASSGSGLVGRIRFAAGKPGQAKVNFGSGTATATSGQGLTIGPMTAVVSVQEKVGKAGAPATPPTPKPVAPGAESAPAAPAPQGPGVVTKPAQSGVEVAPAVTPAVAPQAPPADAPPAEAPSASPPPGAAASPKPDQTEVEIKAP